jgi:hypothetical protein
MATLRLSARATSYNSAMGRCSGEPPACEGTMQPPVASSMSCTQKMMHDPDCMGTAYLAIFTSLLSGLILQGVLGPGCAVSPGRRCHGTAARGGAWLLLPLGMGQSMHAPSGGTGAGLVSRCSMCQRPRQAHREPAVVRLKGHVHDKALHCALYTDVRHRCLLSVACVLKDCLSMMMCCAF